jgi:hypothetical protein
MPLSDLSQPGELCYRQSFLTPEFSPFILPHLRAPFVDLLQLQWAVSTIGDPNAVPSAGPQPDGTGGLDPSLLDPNGLHLTIHRESGQMGRAVLLCVLAPFPGSIRYFRVSADFQLDAAADDAFAPATAAASDLWGVTVIARDGKDARVYEPQTSVAGASHQVRGGSPRLVTLGAGSASTNVLPSPADVGVPVTAAYDDRCMFTLGAYLDCHAGLGQSQLSTSGGYYWENTFTHPFSIQRLGYGFTVSGVGFGLAFPSGAGTARAIIREFRIERWPAPPSVPPERLT